MLSEGLKEWKKTNRHTMGAAKRYVFLEVKNCAMCGSPTNGHTVLGQRMNQSQGFSPRSRHGISVSILKCSVCRLIYSNPHPVPFDIQDHYGIPPEDYWKPAYFEEDPQYFTREIDQLKMFMEIKPGMKSLDIGAGLGKCMIALRNVGFDTYGFEASASFYNMAIDKMKISPANLQQGTLETVVFENDTFDFITFGAVLEHLHDPAGSIEKALQWLKPGGIIHIEVPSSNHLLAKLINLYYRMIGTNYVTNLSPMHEPYHLFEFSLGSFDAHAKRQMQYKILFYEYYVCSCEPFPRFLHPLLTWIMKKTNTGMQLAVWLQKK
jgi:SAM-dependent methyltransferase